MDTPQRRPDVFEKDVDELLQRRLKADAKFAASFIGTIERQLQSRLTYDELGVDRQVRHAGVPGTIDLLLRLFDKKAGERFRVLIENKLDSSFTPTQPERYGSSCVAMSRTGRVTYSVICAPAEYLKTSKYLAPFKARIAYEDIANWIDGNDRSIIDAAILRFSMPYEPDPVPEVRDFHEGYVHLAKELAPELIAKPNPNTSGDRPRDSRTIYFLVKKTLPRYDFLPTMSFSHQCWDSGAPSPSAKIMFRGWAVHESLLRDVAKGALGNTNIYLRKAGGSLGLVRDTPRMDNARPVREQMNAVVTGIRAAASLRAWVYAHETVLHKWAEAVRKETAES